MSITQGVGARVQRVEDDRYLQGHTNFIDGLMLPRMQHVAFVRSADAHALIKEVQIDEALKEPGVSHIMTAEEANQRCLPIRAERRGGGRGTPYQHTDYPVMANGKIRFVGEILAAVVAEDRYVAEDAVEQVFVDVEALTAVVNVEQAMAADAVLVHDELENNRHFHTKAENGDVDGAFAAAAHVVRTEFHTNRHCASPMETRAVVANYDQVEDRLVIWSSTQMPHMIRTKLSDLLQFPEHKIRVIAPDVGGGFGLKCHIYPEELILAALALKLKRPVKWVEDRQENYLAGFHAKEEYIKLGLAFDEAGKITAIDAGFYGDGGAYTSYPFTPAAEPQMAAGACTGPYKIPLVRSEGMALYTNKSTLSVCRGVGLPIVNYALEQSMDRAAAEIGIDPVELRRRNLIQSDDFPYRTPNFLLYDSGDPTASLDQVLDLMGYDALRQEQASSRAEGRYIGIGLSSMIETTTYGKDILAPFGKSDHVALYDSATVRVDPDGGITLSVGTHSHGQGHATTYAQLVASELGCELSDIRFVQGDTDQTPYGSGTWGSRSIVAGGGAVLKASQQIKEKAMKVAAHLLEVSDADVYLTDDGEFALQGVPEKKLTRAEVARAAVFETNLPPGMDAGLEITASNTPQSPFTIATHLAVVEVDPGTGEVKLIKYGVSEDCGRMVNPMVVEGQIMGGVVQGIGSVMFEHHRYDEYGQLTTATMADYLMPTAPEVPNLDIAHMETPSPFSEGGIKGMGEGGAVAPMGAITNAVSDALVPLLGSWQPIDQLPITPQNIFERLNGQTGMVKREKRSE
ncbi:MAG: xanthine dehydrogenase family protein molybdopterin-binding subunit [Pseudomonadota bacterium]